MRTDLQIYNVRIVMNRRSPPQRVKVTFAVSYRQSLGASVRIEQLLAVIANAEDCLSGVCSEVDQVRREVVPVLISEAWCVTRHPHDIWIALHAQKIYRFCACRDEAWMQDNLRGRSREVVD